MNPSKTITRKDKFFIFSIIFASFFHSFLYHLVNTRNKINNKMQRNSFAVILDETFMNHERHRNVGKTPCNL